MEIINLVKNGNILHIFENLCAVALRQYLLVMFNKQ